MKLITRETDYAIRILKAIAEKPGRSAASIELSKELGIPVAFVRKILQVLARKGPLTSTKGKGGGFVLTTPLDKILLVDIMIMFQGPVSLGDCLFGKKLCGNRASCSLRCIILELEGTIRERIKNVTI